MITISEFSSRKVPVRVACLSGPNDRVSGYKMQKLPRFVVLVELKQIHFPLPQYIIYNKSWERHTGINGKSRMQIL